MKKITKKLSFCFFILPTVFFSQDSLTSNPSSAAITDSVTKTSQPVANVIDSVAVTSPSSDPSLSQLPVLPDSGITDLGVAVAPSSIRFRVKPGSTKTEYITITNDTHKPEKFKISMADYDMNDRGAVTQLPAGKSHEFGLSKWTNISPTFVELKPGEAKKIAITVKVPEDSNAYRSAWGIIMVDQTTEKKFITPPNDDKASVVMGVIPVFGFGVYVFQNPPNVKLNKVEITRFNFTYDKDNKYVNVTAKNVGTGLGFCTAYVEINNLNTGYKDKNFVKKFTIFPNKERVLDFVLPGKLPKGKYIATAVLDFGSDEAVEAAEIEFEVK